MKTLLTILAFALTLTLSLSASATAAPGTETGVIKWHNAQRGFGFLKAHKTVEFYGNEFYYQAKSVTNYSVLVDALLSGMGQPLCVTFDLERLPQEDRLEAVNVTIVSCH